MSDLNFLSIMDDIKSKLNDKKILIACSTGVDSMVLLDILMKTLQANQIVVANINHQKRIQSDMEEAFIQKFSKENGLVCYTEKLPHYEGSNFQEWAREKRYQFLYEIAKKENIKYILLAHHADDNLETILMRMIRSSSLEGYAGIRKESNHHDFVIYRPLLEITKDDIYKYAKENALTYFEDASNREDYYSRNRMRHYIIPVLKKENPNLAKAITNYSNTLFKAADYLEKIETNFINKMKIVHNNNEYFAKFDISEFSALDSFLQEQILFRLLKHFSLSKECINSILKMILSNKTKIVCQLNKKLNFIKEYNYIIITTKSIANETFYLKIDTDNVYHLPNYAKLVVDKNICTFITTNKKLWYNIYSYPFIVRSRIEGDKIKTKVGTKSVSDYLTDHKVPYFERQNILLICDEKNQPVEILGYITK
jgi:tRNA(ile)-lysidine synthetase